MKSFDEYAEEYADNATLDENTYLGDVITAFVCGMMKAKEIYEQQNLTFNED